jgi:hypothetical protein
MNLRTLHRKTPNLNEGLFKLTRNAAENKYINKN